MQAGSSCFIPWPTVGGWQHNSFTGNPMTVSHPMTKRQWVTHCFISLPVSSIMSHPMTNREWVTLLYVFASLINHVSFHDQQGVSGSALLPCQQSHQSCLIPWPTESEWNCFISLPGSLINCVSLPMTNREWVTLLYVFARQSHQSCLIPWPTVGCECQPCFISLPVSLIIDQSVSSHDQQFVSDTVLFLC